MGFKTQETDCFNGVSASVVKGPVSQTKDENTNDIAYSIMPFLILLFIFSSFFAFKKYKKYKKQKIVNTSKPLDLEAIRKIRMSKFDQ